MKHGKNMDEVLKRGLRSASADSKEQIDVVGNRVLGRVLSKAGSADNSGNAERSALGTARTPISLWPRIGIAAAAVLLVLATLVVVTWRQNPAMSIVENVTEGFSPLKVGDIVRTGNAGRTVVLPDGSSVEMRAESELSLELAGDGLRIRLNKGVVIVDAVKQHGHLHVQTKDVTVSVVGTVFLVNAEEEGSRVAVIQGQVDVQQGKTTQQLLPGEQVATDPRMPSSSVGEEISWSRNAEAHLALLEQSAFVRTLAGLQTRTQPRLEFEEASVRPSLPVERGGARGGKGPGGCSGGQPPQLDPIRFADNNKYLYSLAATAYFGTNFFECLTVSQLGLLSGGPSWVQSDMWDVQAVIPAGVFSTTPSVRDPKLKQMLQALLEDKFKLVVRREMKEMPVYIMTMKDPEKYAASKDETVWLTPKPREWNEQTDSRQGLVAQEGGAVYGSNAIMTDLAPLLSRLTARPVVDRTGFARKFSFAIEYSIEFSSPEAAARFAATGGIGPGDMASPSGGPRNSGEIKSLITELEKQAGIELRSGRANVEVLVIEHAEKPPEN